MEGTELVAGGTDVRWSRMSAAISRLIEQIDDVRTDDHVGREDLLILLDLVEELNDERSDAEARIARAIAIHKELGHECKSCSKTIGGMTRVVEWPCATVKALRGE